MRATPTDYLKRIKEMELERKWMDLNEDEFNFLLDAVESLQAERDAQAERAVMAWGTCDNMVKAGNRFRIERDELRAKLAQVVKAGYATSMLMQTPDERSAVDRWREVTKDVKGEEPVDEA